MKVSMGKDWRKFFNMVFCNAQKPKFFTEDKPYYVLDEWMDNLKGEIGFDSSEMKDDPSLTYLEGNASILTDFIATKLKNNKPRIAYLGDHYVGDIHHCSKIDGWDGIAIIEELSTVGEEYKEIEKKTPLKPLDLKLVPTQKYWGDYFLHSKTNPKRNYFVHELSKNARYAVPLVRHITNFIDR